MSPIILALAGLALLLTLILLGMPVYFAMLFVGLVGFAYVASPSAAFSLFAIDTYTSFSWYSYTVFPAFLLMGFLVAESGFGRSLYRGAYAWVGRWPGGLAIATQVACGAFGAICGAAVAAAGAMSAATYPSMKEYGYAPSLSTACIAAGSILSPIIPPSVIFILYGILTETSIGELFLAGVFPGLMLLVLYSSAIFLRALRNPQLAPRGKGVSWRERWGSLTGGAVEIFLIFGAIMSAILFGIATPTEIGAFGVAAVLVVSLLRRRLTWQAFNRALRTTTQNTAFLFIALAGVSLIGRFLAVTKVPYILADFFATSGLSSTVIVLILLLLYFVLGFFMDPLMVMLVTLPFFFTTIVSSGIDPVWFGVLIAITCALGGITPPVGIMVYVVHSIVKEVPIEEIFRGSWMFILMTLVGLAILIIFPQIATFLPNLIYPHVGGG